jgi:hypothetical protein
MHIYSQLLQVLGDAFSSSFVASWASVRDLYKPSLPRSPSASWTPQDSTRPSLSLGNPVHTLKRLWRCNSLCLPDHCWFPQLKVTVSVPMHQHLWTRNREKRFHKQGARRNHDNHGGIHVDEKVLEGLEACVITEAHCLGSYMCSWLSFFY